MESTITIDITDTEMMKPRHKLTGKGARSRRTETSRNRKNNNINSSNMAGIFLHLKISDPTANIG